MLKKTVVLVGMMGSGKTAVGTALARRLGVRFIDSDAEIEMAADRTIAEIFEEHGEKFFRDRETQVISRLMDEENVILSTGGGAFLAEVNQRIISEKGISVWLRADVGLLWNRVKHKTSRPLLRTPNPRATLQELCEKRDPSYRNATLTVDAHPDYTIDDMAGKVVEALLTRPDVLEKQ